MKCPRCQEARLKFNKSIGKMQCPACHYRLFEDSIEGPMQADIPPRFGHADYSPEKAAEARMKPVRLKPTPAEFGSLSIVDALVRMRVRSICDDAFAALRDGDRERGIDKLKTATELHHALPSVWYLLATLAENRAEQRDYLEHALVADSGYLPAQAALTVLNAAHEQPTPKPKRPAKEVKCPRCGGQLDFDEVAQEVTCIFCGHKLMVVDNLERSETITTLAAGMLRRKNRPLDWNIGKRQLNCQSCGTSFTLSRRTMTKTCHFCHSRHVVVVGVADHFQQPDLIVPIGLDAYMARLAIEKKLKKGFRAITRLFADPIQSLELRAVYLPFWIFDAEMRVAWSWTNANAHGHHPVLLGDVLWFAGIHPPRSLLASIEPYDLTQGVDYDPRLLAEQPAELYNIDVDRASLDVRRLLGKAAVRRARPSLLARRPMSYDDSGPGRLRTNPSTQFMSYRLGLLPVWVALMEEADGDKRQIVVNGQTGRVALGKLVKA